MEAPLAKVMRHREAELAYLDMVHPLEAFKQRNKHNFEGGVLLECRDLIEREGSVLPRYREFSTTYKVPPKHTSNLATLNVLKTILAEDNSVVISEITYNMKSFHSTGHPKKLTVSGYYTNP